MPYITYAFPAIPHVRCYFQFCSVPSQNTMEENISYEVESSKYDVCTHRRALWEQCGISQYAEALQVHGVTTLFAPMVYSIEEEQNAHLRTLEQADGIATSKANLALLIKTADCQPVLFAHNSGKYIMALHVGWRGNVQCFIQKAVAEFCAQYGIVPEDISAIRGPSLSPAHAEFIHATAEWSPELLRFYNKETQCMNLWDMTDAQLQEAGIPKEQCYRIDMCTYASPHFFSYRRNNKTGRQGSFIIIDKKS